MAVEYKHSRHHVLGENGENLVTFFQNTIRDVKMSDNTTETIRGHILYRTPDCDTAADIPDKVITCNNFNLKKGVTIAVRFTESNIATSPTLNVNDTGMYPIKKNGEVINSDFIVAGHVYMFNFNGVDWDLIGSDGAMKVIKYEDDDVKRYITSVDGEGNNKNLEINDTIYTIGNKMYGKVTEMTAEFEEPNVSANADYRKTYVLDSGFSIGYLIRNIKAIIKGLGSMAFKSEVAISDLESNFKNIANNAVVKSDLYNKLDYSTAGQKALDAAVGKTLDTKITNLSTEIDALDTKLSNMVTYSWNASTATLNIVKN